MSRAKQVFWSSFRFKRDSIIAMPGAAKKEVSLKSTRLQIRFSFSKFRRKKKFFWCMAQQRSKTKQGLLTMNNVSLSGLMASKRPLLFQLGLIESLPLSWKWGLWILYISDEVEWLTDFFLSLFQCGTFCRPTFNVVVSSFRVSGPWALGVVGPADLSCRTRVALACLSTSSARPPRPRATQWGA